MKDSHISLRLPAAIARALDKIARAHAVPKSQVLREALGRYILPQTADRANPPPITAAELLARWRQLPRLAADEAEEMAKDLADARKKIPPVKPTWE